MANKYEFDENRTYGVEIEFAYKEYDGTNSRILTYSRGETASVMRSIAQKLTEEANVYVHAEGYNHTTSHGWKMVTDTTAGFELVSPVLKGKQGFIEITNLMNSLNKIEGVKVGKNQGLHVHHGIGEYLKKDFLNLLRLYKSYESAFDKMVPNSRRENANTYCKSLGWLDIDRLGGCTTIREIIDRIGTRYLKLNLLSYVKYSTVEFRQHGGTTDPRKIINWIMFTQFCVQRAKRSVKETSSDKTFRDLATQFGMGRHEYERTPDSIAVYDFYKKRVKELNKKREVA